MANVVIFIGPLGHVDCGWPRTSYTLYKEGDSGSEMRVLANVLINMPKEAPVQQFYMFFTLLDPRDCR